MVCKNYLPTSHELSVQIAENHLNIGICIFRFIECAAKLCPRLRTDQRKEYDI